MRWDATLRAGGRAALFVFLLAAALIGLALAALQWVATDDGRAFVVKQLAHVAPHSGLRVSVGRLDGNPLNRFTAHDLVLSDPAGPFLIVPSVAVDWRPFAFTGNRLVLHTVDAPTARWLRVPKFRPSNTPDQPILPGFDVALGRLHVGRLDIAPPVAGRAAAASLDARANVSQGRAVVKADVRSTAGDVLALDLDARPDDDRFGLSAHATAPAGGIVAGLTGFARPTTLAVDGRGSWTHWRGRLAADMGQAALARLALSADGGRFAATGTLAPAALAPSAVVARLTGPTLAVALGARKSGDTLTLDARATSPALTLAAHGPIDLARGTTAGIAFSARLARANLVSPDVSGGPLDVSGRASGPLGRLALVATARAPALGYRQYTLVAPQVDARATLGSGPLVGTVRLAAARATGLPPQAAPLALGLVAEGPLKLEGGVVRLSGVALRSTRATARVTGSYALATGTYALAVDARVPSYALAGVGVADLAARLAVAPGPRGVGTVVTGSVTARATRLDAEAARTLAGGLPTVAGRLALTPDGTARVDALTIAAPRLRLAGAAALGPGDTIRARLIGRSADYGPVELSAVGTLARPTADLALASPGLGLGLAAVDAHVRPSASGFDVTARGRSSYGPFVADIGLATAGGLSADVRALTIAGVTARGRIAPAGAVYAGTLALTGSGIDGNVRLSAQGGVQRADLALALVKARLPALDGALTVGRGRLAASLLLPPSGVEGSATADLTDVTRGTTRLTRARLNARYAHGAGTGHLAASGIADAPFNVAADVVAAPGRVQLAASGDIDGQPIRLAAPAVATRDANGWRLAPATLLIADGRATISGTRGADTRLIADLAGIQLDDLAAVGALDMRGGVSGHADFVLPAQGLPQGNLRLLVSRFSRAGLGVSSLPVEIEAAAALRGTQGAARAFIRREGKVLAAMQAALPSIPGDAATPAMERLLAAPLSGQVRLQAPAEALWPLAGVTALDLRGPIAAAASIGGHLGEPQVQGTLTARGARLEAAALGTTITALDLDGRFDGPSLTITRVAGRAGDGSLTGAGRVSYTADGGLSADLKAQLTNALMIKTDMLRTAVSGPAQITLGPLGGLISGDVRIDSARYQLGTTPAEQVPELKVREIGARPPTGRRPADPETQWRLALHAVARSRFNVRGLGLDSDWGADVRIGGAATQPEITGRATLARGTYEFSGKSFRLDRGEIRFTGEYPPNPSVDIQATANVTGLTAVLNIGGSAFRPEIAFTSTPALPEDEVLSRLLFGSSVTDLSAPEALQLAAAVAQLRGGSGGGLNPVNALRRVTGLDRLKVNGADKTTGRGTSVAAGKYIGRNVYVELATDAKGYTATQIEISLTRWLSLLSSVASQGSNRVSVKVSKDY